jgi:hypothetical protein
MDMTDIAASRESGGGELASLIGRFAPADGSHATWPPALMLHLPYACGRSRLRRVARRARDRRAGREARGRRRAGLRIRRAALPDYVDRLADPVARHAGVARTFLIFACR